MKAFKKIASLILASSMLIAAIPANAVVVDPAELQTAIAAKVEGYKDGSVSVELGADTDVKKDDAETYGDKYISAAVKKNVAKNEGASLKGDFLSTLDMTKVKDVFNGYVAAAEEVCGEDATKLAALQLIPVTGQFVINVVYDAKMQFAEGAEAYHTTVGSMNGFNEEAKRIFKDTKREILTGKVVLADNTVVENEAYNTLQITVDVIAPPAEFAWDGKTGDFATKLVYADLKNYTDDLLGDISYTVDDVTVSSDSYTDDLFFTESISMSGSIKIGGAISTVYFSTVQAEDGANNYKDVEDWQDISATMALKITSSSGGGGGTTPNYTAVPHTAAPIPTATPDPAETVDPNATMDPNTPSSTIPPYTPGDNKVPSVLNGDDHYVYIIGYPEGDVRPEGNITREEVATIFYRILKDEFRDTIYTKNHNYSDVELSRWSNKAIATLTNGGFIQGYGDDANTFKPAGDMTRLEFIVMATNFLDESDSEVKYLDDVKFTDVPERLSWGQEALQKAAVAELIDEDERTAFRPEEKIKRHEAMKIINRLLVRNVKADGLIDGFVKWPDNPEDAKYYFEVIEATNSHTFERLSDGYEKWTSVDQNWIWGEFKTQYEDPDEIDKQ